MSNASPAMRAAWRHPEGHVGPRKPEQYVEVRRGVMDHLYQHFAFLDGSTEKFGSIARSKHNARPWQGQWRPTGDWIRLPNLDSVDIAQALTGSNGVKSATIVLENVIAKEWAGLVGSLHLILRGYLSPFYGFAVAGRSKQKLVPTNEWLNVLNGGYQVRVWQGFGTELTPRFVGIIDDTDVAVNPDTITLTCRDFGAFLTDQRVFGWNKARELKSPIIFADRRRAMKVKKVGSRAVASSSSPAHPATGVQQQGDSAFWLSGGHSDPAVTEWVEIHLPAGTYEDFWLWPRYDGMELWISVYARNAKVDGAPVADGWIDRSSGDQVPGANGGHTYIRHHDAISGDGNLRKLGFTLECGSDTVIRCSFRRLPFNDTTQDHRAGVNRMVAYRLEGLKKDAKIQDWILIDDAADIAKWVFMWVGFKEWEVEDFGTSIVQPMAFHQTDYLIDIISHLTEQGDVNFFMKGPSSDPESIGVPVLRYSRALKPQAGTVEEVRDTDLLTGIEPKFSKQDLSYIIRARGKTITAPHGGVKLGEDTVRRYQGVYLPPWSGAYHGITNQHIAGLPDRLAGLRKHVVHTDPLLTSNDLCLKAAVLIAVQEALGWATATVEVPGDPGFELDEHLSVIDTTSGSNSRLWAASLHSTFTSGTNAQWKVSLSGSLIDTPDMKILQRDAAAITRRVQSDAP